MDVQYAEVVGVVGTVKKSTSYNEPVNFKIKCPNMNKTFDAVCGLFCPVREGDTIYAYCMVSPDGKFHIAKPPFVQPPLGKESVVQCFFRCLKQGYKESVKLYDKISEKAEGDHNVIPYLSQIAQAWNDTHKVDLLYMFDTVDSDDVKKLLGWWHRERNVRRLWLLGLNKKEINACRLTCDQIYQKCMENPYTLPAIPLEKCDEILGRLNKIPDKADRMRGFIMRIIWKNLHESGWTATPSRHLSTQFPTIKEHVPVLKSHYGMIPDFESAYLDFPHKVECWVADYIINKVKQDVISYDTPLDEKLTINGKMVERQSAIFNRELSEDQMKAVQGALDHSLSIVTGGAGVGKCHGHGTKVLMFDGSIKEIQNIKEGELVMGPDSTPRTVLSTCTGTDNMFEVIPSKGKSFICNEPHMLTLMGCRPLIKQRREKYIVTFTNQGMYGSKSFDTEHEAEKFVFNLKEDIFDMSLKDYLAEQPSKRQAYLFHVGVHFPSKEVPFDPYVLGFWLGSSCQSSEISTKNPQVIEKLTELLPNAEKIPFKKGDSDYVSFSDNRFRKVLKELDLYGNKHIPNLYKINSRSVRLKLLAGMIDASASVANKSCIVFCFSTTKLTEDVEYLGYSLGFMVTSRMKKKGGVTDYNTLHIYGAASEHIPIVSDYKKCFPSAMKRATCQGFYVKPMGQGQYYGFQLTGDGRYLLGDFLVTHNTTVLGQIIHNLELRGITYAVCAFTGKAVARIREVTKKRNPSTIHRLISNSRKTQQDMKSTAFEKEIPLMEYSHIIIDEISMVTTELFYDLIQAFPNVEKITLVGDVNQLQPISWGSLFHEVLKSETVPTYKLTTNFRVYTSDGERDGIILNANAIVSHDPMFPFEFVPTTNFSVIEGPEERIYDIIKACFSSGVKAEQLVVISPYNKSLPIINKTFQQIYNSGARSITDSRGIKWMIGDRVMLTENDQQIGVFNGETGIIRDITKDGIMVDFGNSGCHDFLLEPSHDRIHYEQATAVSYYKRGKQMEDVLDGDEGEDDERTVKRLAHAYALTVDKSQGSEWDFVILYISEFNTGSFLNKNRIYTAITRAKRCVWAIVTDADAFNVSAVKTPPYRCENLSKRIVTHLPNLKPFKIPGVINLEMEGDAFGVPEPDFGYDCDDF